ncbi:Zn(2)-C6 fungal-type domain-containing protein [Favolaschia claudopus]|uniref:Zn(2)-C6 fungal-type domain-containing protein n=1 Tax=Favolaschia claudopus TaxID=2862362 RepID=A0AAW0EF32_9AGAR
MSSVPPRNIEEGDKESAPKEKRKRLQGACDICRKRKVRCDSAERPGEKCTNCTQLKTQCTHLYVSKESSSKVNYKNCREHVAAILSQTQAYVPSNDPTVLYQILIDIAKYARNLEELLAASEPYVAPGNASDKTDDSSDDGQVSIDGVLVDPNIHDPLRRLSLRVPLSGADDNYRFFGMSSSMNFIREALQYAGETYTFDAQRPEFWVSYTWQKGPVQTVPVQSFPDDDLLQDLVDIYFKRLNPLIFILHSMTFRAALADGEHLRDPYFGAVVLVSTSNDRLSDDPRVLASSGDPVHSAGWKWFNQAQPLRIAISPPSTSFRWIYKLQVICLSLVFLTGTTNARQAWTLSCLGIRTAQEMGAHRLSRYNTGSRVEGELLKRAFWVLITVDTIMNSLLGRPKVTSTAEYDVDIPAAVDDQYWLHPYSFVQPSNTLAETDYMRSYLKLMVIHQRMQESLYGIKRDTKRVPAIVAELDSDLNSWLDSVPNHLRWDANLEGIWLDQSASLYMHYYHVQLLIHRPFIPSVNDNCLVNFPSLAICANSARSLGHVMELHAVRSGDVLHQPLAMSALFDACVILLLNVWDGRRRKLTPNDITRAANDIKKCVHVLHLYEKRYPFAGRKCDIVREIFDRASGHMTTKTNPQLKRSAPDDFEAQDALPPNQRPPELSPIEQLENLARSIKQTDHLFTLPFSSKELGLLPIYEPFDFRFGFDSQPPEKVEMMPSQGEGYGPRQRYNSGPSYSWPDWRNGDARLEHPY